MPSSPSGQDGDETVLIISVHLEEQLLDLINDGAKKYDCQFSVHCSASNKPNWLLRLGYQLFRLSFCYGPPPDLINIYINNLI